MISRRDFCRTSAAAAITAALGGSVSNAKQARKPNIIVIMADDMGFSDLGCYGSEIRTPNLDRLAAEGIRFTHAYNAARCCPSRASLLTGLYPHQAGMGSMVSRPENPKPEGPYQGYLNSNCATIPELLRPAGYKTYMSGKWHVGERPEHWPRRRGFDRYYGLISGGSSYYEILEAERNIRTMVKDDDTFLPDGDQFYMTDAFSDFAVECIEKHPADNIPYFLYLAYTAPHWPIHAWEEDIAKYRGSYMKGWDVLREERYARQLELGIIDPKWKLSPRDPEAAAWESVSDKEERDLRMAVYAAMVDRMDQGVGRVLDAVKKSGGEDNTMVVFLSDNGGCHESVEARNLHIAGKQAGERGSFLAYQRPWANASNTPFRMFKHWTHEGGIATPFIVHWPGHIAKPGSLTHQFAHINDIMPTCLDIAGVTYPEAFYGNRIPRLPGSSFAPILDGKKRAQTVPVFWEHNGNKAIRSGKWKLVAPARAEWELYDLEADRTELTNLADKEGRRADRMLADWTQWAGEVGAKV